MFSGFCDWGSLGDFGVWGGTGLIFNLIFWVGLIAALAVLVVWVIRHVQVTAGTGPYDTGRPTTKEILQAQYAKGEITREQYELKKQVIG